MEAVQYFKHNHGCGTFHVDVWVCIRDTKVTLCVQFLHMGRDRQAFVVTGDYLPIGGSLGGSYGLVQFLRFTDHTHAVPSEVAIEWNYDCYQFDVPQPTEWFQHIDRVQIGLYCGNGCHCTEQFQLHMIENKFIGHVRGNEESAATMRTIENLKYETCNEAEYQRGVDSVTKSV